MNQHVPLPESSPPASGDARRRHADAQLLENPHRSHAVQFYDGDAFLFETVGHVLRAGLSAGDRVLVIATLEHAEGIENALGKGVAERARATHQLTLIDAREMLSEFMLGSMPDPALFRNAIARVLAVTEAYAGSAHPRARLRAFGEMVDVLSREGNSRAAIRLEELWNEVGQEHDFSLLCAYMMGNFYREGDTADFVEVCHNHSHVLPTETIARLEDDSALMREVSLLQQRARLLEGEIHTRKEVEHALRSALEERARVELELRASLEREQAARKRAQASDSFKDVFSGILGHDLRNPLNTILTTARLMALRGELGPESHRRLDRVISSGVRMQRMIEQILDMARDRLTTGISVTRGAPRDLAPLVSKVVEEIHLAYPSHSIEFQPKSCVASVDSERLEQVIANLLGNAATHGDPREPIVVTLAEWGKLATFSVRNHGPAIDPAELPLLFDPFRRVRKPEGRSEGLGLGLYISARVIEAHGGKIHVESSEGGGTLFEASFPRDP